MQTYKLFLSSPRLIQSSYVLVSGMVCNIIGIYMKYRLDYIIYLPDTNTYREWSLQTIPMLITISLGEIYTGCNEYWDTEVVVGSDRWR